MINRRIGRGLAFIAVVGVFLTGGGASAQTCFDEPTRDCLIDMVLKAPVSDDEFHRDRAFVLRTYLGALRGDDAVVDESLRIARDAKSKFGLGARLESLCIVASVTGSAALFREALERIYHDVEYRGAGYAIVAREAMMSGMTGIATEATERIVREGWRPESFMFTLGSYITKPEEAFAAYGSIRGAAAAQEFLDRQLSGMPARHRQSLLEALVARLIALQRLEEASAVVRQFRLHDVRDYFEVAIAAARGGADAKGAEGRARRIRDDVLKFRALGAVAAATRDQALVDELKRMAQPRENRLGLLAFLARAFAEHGWVEAAAATIEELAGDKGWQAQALFDAAFALKRSDFAARALKLSYDTKDLRDLHNTLLVNRALRMWR